MARVRPVIVRGNRLKLLFLPGDELLVRRISSDRDLRLLADSPYHIFLGNAQWPSALVNNTFLKHTTGGALSWVPAIDDHGGLGGLGDVEDHPDYSLIDGTRPFTGTVGGIDPVAGTDLVTKDYVDTAVQEAIYTPDSVTLNVGSLISGDIDSVKVLSDADEYIVDEVAATPGLDFEFDFSGVMAYNQVWIHVKYLPGSTYVNVDFWNYTTSAWNTKTAIYTTSDLQFIIILVPDTTDYLSGGAVKISFYNPNLGVITNEIAIDYLAVVQGGLGAATDHGALTGLDDDDHGLYHNDARGDARYFTEAEHIDSSAGAGDAGKPIKLDADGQVDATMINDSDIDHNSITNTHNLTTDIDHDSITNTHNLTTDIDHNALTNYEADEHVALPNTIANVLTDHDLAEHTALGLREVITANTTYYLATTGDDNTGDGTVGNPWLTIAKVWSYLAAKSVNADVTITVQLADGTYSYTPSTLKHNDTITSIIQGTNTYSKTMSSVQSSSGGAGAWSIIINLDNVTNIAVNDYVIILSATGGTNPNLMVGCHKVTDVDAVNNRITVTSLSQSASVPSGNVICTVTVLKSILSYTASGGLVFSGQQYCTVKNLCIVESNNVYHGLRATAGASLTINTIGFYIAICAATDFGLITGNSTNCASSGAYYGFSSGYKSIVYLNVGNFAITGSPGAGLISQNDGFLHIRASYISGNVIGAQAATGGWITSLNNFYTSNGTQTSPAINTQGTTMNFISSSGDTFA